MNLSKASGMNPSILFLSAGFTIATLLFLTPTLAPAKDIIATNTTLLAIRRHRV